jgi:vacuolar protein-sorting-associated protein 4
LLFLPSLSVGDTPNSLTEQDFMTLGEMADGYSGSDVAVVVREALMEPLRKCQSAKQFLRDSRDGYYLPCSEYPNCMHCPMELHLPLSSGNNSTCNSVFARPGQQTTCSRCGATRMSLYDVPQNMLRVPVVEYADFLKALGKAHSSVGSNELQTFESWTEEFGQEG